MFRFRVRQAFRVVGACLASQVLEWIEYFAGAAEVTKHVRACGYKSRCFDITYPVTYKSQNYMDLLTPAGMASEAQALPPL